MGVPVFFKWLITRYPKILIDFQCQGQSQNHYKSNHYFKNTNTNETQKDEVPLIDNLYLDMNGIIHPCCHPENKVIIDRI